MIGPKSYPSTPRRYSPVLDINLQEDLIEAYQQAKGDTYLRKEKIGKDASLSLASPGIQLEARNIWG